MKLNKKSKTGVVGLSSFFALLAVLGTAVACPSASMMASAATEQSLKIDFSLESLSTTKLTIDFFLANGNPDYVTFFKQLGIDFLLNSSISMTMDKNTVSATVDPVSTTANFVSAYQDLSVTTNGAEGVSVYVYSTDGETAMISGTNRIPTLSGAVGQANFTSDRWGYSLTTQDGYNSANLQYKGLATAAVQGGADYTKTGAGSNNLRLTFGAKVSMDSAAGTYTRDVRLNAVSPAEVPAMISEARNKINQYIETSLENDPELKAEVEARKAANGGQNLDMAGEFIGSMVNEDQE